MHTYHRPCHAPLDKLLLISLPAGTGGCVDLRAHCSSRLLESWSRRTGRALDLRALTSDNYCDLFRMLSIMFTDAVRCSCCCCWCCWCCCCCVIISAKVPATAADAAAVAIVQCRCYAPSMLSRPQLQRMTATMAPFNLLNIDSVWHANVFGRLRKPAFFSGSTQ